jgi:hypothetical protein
MQDMTQSPPRIGAVVLAGGRVPTDLAHRCAHRALLRVGEQYLLTGLLATLAQTAVIGALATVAPREALSPLQGLPGRFVPAGDTLVANMRAGAHALADFAPTHLLFVTGDLPLLTVAGLEAYIAASLASDAALTYPVIPRAATEARFPGAKRTYVRLREDTFTGGNLLWTTTRLLDDQQALIQALYAARKSPFRLAHYLGWRTVVHLLTGTLTLPYLEGVASRLLAAPARAIITPHPELGFDIDKAADLAAVERALETS